MAWEADTNTWTAPNTTWGGSQQWGDVYTQLKKKYSNWDTMNGQQRLQAFQKWWTSPDAKTWFSGAWEQQADPWQQLYQDWLNDQAGTKWTGTQPVAPDLVGLQQQNQASLTGIQEIIAQLAGESAGGGDQYYNDWLSKYAEQAGFESPEARESWLQQQRANQTELQDMLKGYAENPTQITPEQQKLIREQQRQQEETARKQAIASYQETGSYAALQRASDELNQASINQAMKSQLEMANQNFATALAAANQQTETLMREVESGNASFQDYVALKQQGVSQALASWQNMAQSLMQETEQQMYAAQTQFGNESAQYQQSYQEWLTSKEALDRQGDLIMQAAAAAMGQTYVEGQMPSLDAAMENFYNQMVQELSDQFDVEQQVGEVESQQNQAKLNSVIGIGLTALGFVLMFVPGFQEFGAGALVGGIKMFGGNITSAGLKPGVTGTETATEPNAAPPVADSGWNPAYGVPGETPR